MKILVTGAAGFIGSHIVDELLDLGHTVIGIDNLANGRLENLALHDKFTFIQMSVLNKLDEFMVDVVCVCHQAALGSVPRSIEEPDLFFKNNVMGFQNVLETARKFDIKRVVYASSSSIYGDELGKPMSPYAMTKQINEMQAYQYAKQYGMSCIGLRYFNVFGPRQRFDSPYAAVIPRWIDAIENDHTIYINGDGKQMRDFTYVYNAVDANVMALTELENISTVVDVGTGNPIDVELLSVLIGNMLKKPVKSIYRPDVSPGALRSCANKKNILGWQPEWFLQEGLMGTIDAYFSTRTQQSRPLLSPLN